MPKFTIELVEIDKLEAWEKNPRERDMERFNWIKLSIEKFGFVSPLYADLQTGMLFSGHQRTAVAKMMGLKKVPVVWLPPFEENATKALNLAFNLCTNDHSTKADFGGVAKEAIKDMIPQIERLPNSQNPYPVMNWFEINPFDYTEVLAREDIDNTMKQTADKLGAWGIDIPILLAPDGTIINGVNRLKSAIGFGRVSYPAVTILNHGKLLKKFMNKITMSFNLEKTFGEELRYNAFFPRLNQSVHRKILGVGFYEFVFAKEAKKGKRQWLIQNLTKLEGENRARWIAEHGTTVIDFGAGRLDNTRKLQQSGINCIPFEPYILRPKTDIVCYKTSRLLAQRFLSWVKQKNPLSSVFCSSVFNQVPFADDREHLMVIFRALCMHGAKLYLHTLGAERLAKTIFKTGDDKTQRTAEQYLLDDEPGLMISHLLDFPRIQKYHTKQELIDQGKRYFYKVDYFNANASSHGIRAEQARLQDWGELVRALEFEFNLPYPEDKRMNLVTEAIEAFSSFCGVDLFEFRNL